MEYRVINNVHVVSCPVDDFAIKVVDAPKKSAWSDNYCNAGFFSGPYYEKNPYERLTLPVCNLKADYCINTTTKPWSKHYADERGKFTGSKWEFNSYTWKVMNGNFPGKTTLNLVVYQGKASIVEMKNVNDRPADYVIGGVPLMVNGADVKFDPYVKSQGWDGSTLYATKHIMLGVNRNKPTVIYIMGWKSTSGNMITSAEAYRKLTSLGLGLTDVIKVDGGGSYHLKVNGKVVDSISTENRQINNIITFGPTKTTTTASTSTNASTVTESTVAKTVVYGTTTAKLNMRTGPGLSYSVATVIPKNATVTINMTKSTNSWYYVSHDGKAGYCSTTYITTTTRDTSTNTTTNSGKLTPQNPYAVPTRTLKRGCTGNDVKWLQWMLVKIGISPSPGAIDGSFGPGVYKSVVAWQKAYGLSADGSFGPVSRTKMLTL